jgi:MFS family permease
VRLATRHIPDRYGERPMILAGFSSLALSMVLYLVVRSEWWLIVPALAAGTGHALLFPSVTAGGCSTFPARYRGLAATLMLAMYDVGSLLGQPVVGGTIEWCENRGWPPYPTMFLGTAAAILLFVVAVWFSRNGSVRSEPAANQP